MTIVSHSNRSLLLRCLAALNRDGVEGRLEILILDNASEDGSADAVREQFPDVRIIEQRHRAGFGENQNHLLRLATGRYILVLNDDAFVEADAIDTLVRYIDEHPKAGAVAPRIVTPGGRLQQTAWRFPTPWSSLVFALTLGRLRWVQSGRDSPGRVSWASACAVLLRRDALDRVGVFDESFFMYSEDRDLGKRLAEAGYETHYVPASRVVHHGQQSSRGADAARRREQARSLRAYLRKHQAPQTARLTRFLLAFGFALRALAAALVKLIPPRLRPEGALRWNAYELAAFALDLLRGPTGPGLREKAADWNAEHVAADCPGDPTLEPRSRPRR